MVYKENSPQKILLLCKKFFITEFQWENTNRNGGHGQEGHVRDRRNIRMTEMSRRERKMEVSSEEDQGSEKAVAP